MKPIDAIELPTAVDLTLVSFMRAYDLIIETLDPTNAHWELRVASQNFGFAMTLKAVFPMMIELDMRYNSDEWSLHGRHVKLDDNCKVEMTERVVWSPGA